MIQADQVGHLVMEPGQAAYEAVVKAFEPDAAGKETANAEGTILRPDGTIDRGVLGSIVFADKGKLEILNSIVHPAVKDWIRREVVRQQEMGCRLLIIEAALLIEDHYSEICQELWYIHTDAQVRRVRLKASRGYTDERIDSIFRNQLSEEAFRQACQVVIDNSGSLEETKKQIRNVITQKEN